MKISRNIRKIKTEEMAEFNLKSPHVSCIYYLYAAGPMTSKELCRMCKEDKAAVSRSIDYLEREGYISCDTQAKKRYNSPLALTEEGKVVGKRISEKIDRIFAEASEGLSEENRIILYRSLQLVSDNMQKMTDNYGD